MQKLITGSLLLVILAALNTQVYAMDLNCKFKKEVVEGVNSIKLSDESLFINKDLEIPLEKSRVKCGNFGKQTRFDGNALGFQIILKSCTTEGVLEGHLIDALRSIAADVICKAP